MTLLNSRVIRISTASILAGVLIGLVGGAFRYLLIAADSWRDALIAWAHRWPHIGWLAPVALGLVGAAAARLLVVRFAPAAEGSGIQRVEAVFSGEVEPAPPAIVSVKFFGGLLAMGSGLALGREGPTVQMGASLSGLISHFLIKDDEDVRIIGAAGAGAGLAVAFNAPIGGSIFVFEELTSSFTPWLMVATLAAAVVAVWIMRLMLGNALDFSLTQVSLTQVWRVGPFLVLGALLGAFGAVYNICTVGLLRFGDSLRNLSSVNRAAIIGATVGLAAWFAPALVGGGDVLTQTILVDPQGSRGAADGIPRALSSWPVVLCRTCAGRYLCPALSAGRFLRRALRRSPESLPASSRYLVHCLCGDRDGGAILGQRSRAADGNRAYCRNDRPRRPDPRLAGCFSDGHGGRDVA